MQTGNPFEPSRSRKTAIETRASSYFRIGATWGFATPLVFVMARIAVFRMDRWLNPIPPGTAECGNWVLGLIGLGIGGPPLFALVAGFSGWILGGIVDRVTKP